MTAGPLWAGINDQPRRSAIHLSRGDIPRKPGVYVWYRDGRPIYSGRAVGKDGLRGRVWSDHLKKGTDLSRSSFRRNVCAHLGIAETNKTTLRPTVMTVSEIEPVNRWVRECEVTWIECETRSDAVNLEKALLGEWMPPLSRR